MKTRNTLGFLWTSVSFALLLAVCLLAVFLIIVPKFLGAVPLTILTSSMRPAMPPGALVVVQPIDASDVRIGQVITYQLAPGDPTLITHRVIAINTSSSGKKEFILQGDNNGTEDAPIVAEQVMGKVVYSVPYFGLFSNKVNTGEGQKYTRYVAYGLIGYGVLLGLGSLRRGKDAPKTRCHAALRRARIRRPRPHLAPRHRGTRRAVRNEPSAPARGYIESPPPVPATGVRRWRRQPRTTPIGTRC